MHSACVSISQENHTITHRWSLFTYYTRSAPCTMHYMYLVPCRGRDIHSCSHRRETSASLGARQGPSVDRRREPTHTVGSATRCCPQRGALVSTHAGTWHYQKWDRRGCRDWLRGGGGHSRCRRGALWRESKRRAAAGGEKTSADAAEQSKGSATALNFWIYQFCCDLCLPLHPAPHRGREGRFEFLGIDARREVYVERIESLTHNGTQEAGGRRAPAPGRICCASIEAGRKVATQNHQKVRRQGSC